jgi:hypothetical protein
MHYLIIYNSCTQNWKLIQRSEERSELNSLATSIDKVLSFVGSDAEVRPCILSEGCYQAMMNAVEALAMLLEDIGLGIAEVTP